MICRTQAGVGVTDRLAVFNVRSKVRKAPAGPNDRRLLEAPVRYALAIPLGRLHSRGSTVVVRACS